MEIMVEFILVSHDFPLEEVYEKIGLDGKKEHFKEAIFRTMSDEKYLREEHHCITYSTGYIETIDVGEPVEQIFKILHSREKTIVQCIEEFKLQSKFCIVINLTDNPIIDLKSKFIDMASRFHAEIEFDSYVNYNRRGRVLNPRSWFNSKRQRKTK